MLDNLKKRIFLTIKPSYMKKDTPIFSNLNLATIGDSYYGTIMI